MILNLSPITEMSDLKRFIALGLVSILLTFTLYVSDLSPLILGLPFLESFIIRFVFFMTFFMSIFTPLPLTFSFLLFGRARSLGLIAVSLIVILISGWLGNQHFEYFFFYLAASFMAFLSSEIIIRNIHPSRGLFMGGSIFLSTLGIVLLGVFGYFGVSPQEDLVKSIILFSGKVESLHQELFAHGANTLQDLMVYLDQPDIAANLVLVTFPSLCALFCFFWMWMTLCLVLRNKAVFQKTTPYKYSLKSLLNYRVPDYVVIPFIMVAAITYYAHKSLGYLAFEASLSALYCFALFYFFQGVGVFFDFLKFLKLPPFIKSFFAFFTLFSAYKLIAVLGLLDNWLNLRQRLKQSKKE